MVFSFVLRAACARSLCVVVRCFLRITRLRNFHATAFMFVLSSSCCRCFMRFFLSEAEANLKQRYHVFRVDKQRSQDPFAVCHNRSFLFAIVCELNLKSCLLLCNSCRVACLQEYLTGIVQALQRRRESQLSLVIFTEMSGSWELCCCGCRS